MHFHIKNLLKEKEYEKDMKIELSKQNNKKIDIKSENNSSEKNDENNFQYFDNSIISKSDESKCKSKDYTNDKTDDNKINDNKS